MFHRGIIPRQLAKDLGVSSATVSRWLSAKDSPSLESCQRLAEYTGAPIQKVLVRIGQLPQMDNEQSRDWPEFREYANQKYPDELDEDLVTMIEFLIHQQRARRYGEKAPRMGI